MTGIQPLQKEYTTGIVQIYAFSFLILIPVIALFVIPYLFIWNKSVAEFLHVFMLRLKNNWDSVFLYINVLRDVFIVSLLFIGGAVLHELLHAVSWISFTRMGIKSLKFGFSKTDFSPYIHCTEPLKVWVYRLGTIVPALSWD